MTTSSTAGSGFDPPDSPWTTHSNEVVYDNPWITVSHREVTTPTGSPGIYGHVHYKNVGIAILPIDDDDHTWLVGQYRYAIGRYSWEVPEGGGPLGVDEAESAQRELREECGLEADRLELILSGWLSNSVSDEGFRVYVATGLRQVGAEPDDTEVLRLRRVSVDEAIDMVLTGEIDDALSQLALLRLAALRRSGSAPG